MKEYLVGGILGVLTSIFSEPIRERCFGAKLNIEFNGNSEDFCTPTYETPNVVPVSLEQSFDTQRVHWQAEMATVSAFYIRVKVTNSKTKLAKSSRAYLVNVEKKIEGKFKFKPTIYCDSLQLPWSHDGHKPVDLPKGISKFVDVIATRSTDSSNYEIQTNPKPNRYIDLFKEQGIFRFTIMVSGDGVIRPEFIKITLDWKGKWDDFKVYRNLCA